MANTRILKVEVFGDAKPLKKAFREAESASEKLGRNFQELGRRATVAFAAIGAGALVIGRDLVDAASDLNEAVSRSQVVFGDVASEIEAFADTAAMALGQSRTQAINAATDFAVFGKSADLAGQDLVDFATEFTVLASDLASFNNTTPEEAILAIGAAMRGESEPIRRYGVLLNDAALKARALEMGIYDGEGALTAQQKVLAASAEILAQTSDAQGDFARTSDGVANATRIVSARFADLKATLGQALLPVAQRLLEVVIDRVIPAMERLGERVIPVLRNAFERLREIITPVVRAVRDFLAPIIERIVEFARNNMDTVKAFFAGFGGTMVAAAIVSVATAIGGFLVSVAAIPVAIGAAVAGLVHLYRNNERFRQGVQKVVRFLVDKAFPAVVSAAKAVGRFIVRVWPTIRDAVVTAAEAIWKVIRRVFPIVRDVVVTVVRAVARFVQEWWPKIRDAVIQAAEAIWRVVKPVFMAVMALVQRFIQFVRDHWGEISEAAKNVAKVIGTVFGVLVAIIKKAIDIIVPVLQFFWNVFEDGFNGFKIAVEGVVDFLEGIFDIIVGLLRGDFSQVWDGIKRIVTGAFNVIRGLVTAFKDQMFEALRLAGIADVFRGVWDGLVGIVTGVFANVKRAIGEFIRFVRRLFDLSNLGDVVGNIFAGIGSRISSAFAGARNALKIGINRIIYMINWLIRKWNGLEFRIPSILPGIGDRVVGVPDIPEIPRLASGGIVTAPTLALIGEAGPEAVVPLGAGMGATYNLTVNAGMGADGQQIGQQIVNHIRDFERTSGTSWRAA